MEESFENLKNKALENKHLSWSHYLYNAIPKKFLKGKILEVGCGTGLTQILSKHSDSFRPQDYLGFDCINFETNYLNIVKGEAVSFDYSSYKYDTLLAVAIAEHIDFYQWEELIKKWKENLNENGYLVIMTPFKECAEQFYKQYFEKVKKETEQHGIYISHRTFYITKKTFQAFLGKPYYFKRVRQHLHWREKGETLLWAIMRFIKRVITFHPYVMDNLLGRNKCLLFVYKKEQ